jgi:superfamily II DNA or RNA helicase
MSARSSRRVDAWGSRLRWRDRDQAMVLVPGAGKTLVGLNVATRRREEASPTPAVFLSGNAPLVAVLRAALTRDANNRRRKSGEKQTSTAGRANPVKAFIQNVHHFRDTALRDTELPPFEEA